MDENGRPRGRLVQVESTGAGSVRWKLVSRRLSGWSFIIGAPSVFNEYFGFSAWRDAFAMRLRSSPRQKDLVWLAPRWSSGAVGSLVLPWYALTS